MAYKGCKAVFCAGVNLFHASAADVVLLFATSGFAANAGAADTEEVAVGVTEGATAVCAKVNPTKQRSAATATLSRLVLTKLALSGMSVEILLRSAFARVGGVVIGVQFQELSKTCIRIGRRRQVVNQQGGINFGQFIGAHVVLNH